MTLRLGVSGTRVQSQHDAVEAVADVPQAAVVHDQTITVGELRLAADVGLGGGFAVGAVLPARRIGASIRYLDAQTGEEVALLEPEIHHRNEVLVGLGDPSLLARYGLGGTRWRLTLRAGVSLPLGRTEEDPFRLGDMGLAHQHIQFGTGTWQPQLGLDAQVALGGWQLAARGFTQQSVYANGKGYQAGDRYAVGALASSGFGLRSWSFRAGVDLQKETEERWHGEVNEEEGNQGRIDLLLAGGAALDVGGGVAFTADIRVPVYTDVVGGQVQFPLVAELGVRVTLGVGNDDHGHDDAHDHGHDHAHEDVPESVDWTDVDVVEVAKQGEAVDLVPVPGVITVFDFWADWCVPCRRLDRLMAAVARRHPGRLAIRKLNIVDWDSPAAKRYLVPQGWSLPHVEVLGAGGEKLYVKSGEPEVIADAIEQLLLSAGSP